MNRARVAFALLCGLAVCCSVMYITADAGDDVEYTAEAATAHSLYGDGPKSVSSEDVQKAGTIFTNTPDGRMRLVDYLTNVEEEIAAEEAARKRDVQAVREQMDRNMAFNAAARARLQKMLLHKMKENAEQAKRDLGSAMRYVQFRFARAAALSNRREKANEAEQKRLRVRITKDKKHAAAQLKTAVTTQQNAMSSLRDSMNARIKSTNKRVSQNAAQIKASAKAAREALQAAVHKFDKKANNAREEAKKGRSKLAVQLETQDKNIRQWANNKLKVVMEKTAAQFNRVRAKMAADRHHADIALKAATGRMTASLNAEAALESKRFAENTKDIAAAKKEAAARVKKAEADFKTRILLLRATVKKQVADTNARITALSGTVEKNKLAQAKINANVEAEEHRMIKIGNARYKDHLKKDKELATLVAKNKAANDARMKAMAAHYTAELDQVRATMKKNRAHASKMLAKKTSALYGAIGASEKAQMAKNHQLNAQLAQSRLDIANSLRAAKSDFTKRMGNLNHNIARNDRKFQKKMQNLAGVVQAHEQKNAAGRKELSEKMKANKEELDASVAACVRKGEARMAKAEFKLKDMNKKTKASLNMRISAAIAKQKKRASEQIEGLKLNSKESRSEMRKFMLMAVRDACGVAKSRLAKVVKSAKAGFEGAIKMEAASGKVSAAKRAGVMAKVAGIKKSAGASLGAAVGTYEKCLLALKSETSDYSLGLHKKKKKAVSVTHYADVLKQIAASTEAVMKASLAALTAKVTAAKAATKAAATAGSAGSAAASAAALSEVEKALAKAGAASNAKYAGLFKALASQRSAADTGLSAAIKSINDAIAKQAALADSRFSKTVKNINAARKQAAQQVSDSRKAFATYLALLIATSADIETKLSGVVNTASGAIRSHKAFIARENRRVHAEVALVEKLSNKATSDSVRARGKLRALLDENKRAAYEEVKALGGLFGAKIAQIRKTGATSADEEARDLSAVAEKLYSYIAGAQLKALFAKNFHQSKATFAPLKAEFNARLDTLTNLLALGAKSAERGYEVLTGVMRSGASGKDRHLLVEQSKAMLLDMNRKLVRSIQVGETKASRLADRARINTKASDAVLLIGVFESVEAIADHLFAGIQGSRQKIADNYLSLKAYAVTAESKINNYVIKGKGRNLSSLGDLLVSIASLSSVKVRKAEGIGAGASSVPAIFSTSSIKVDDSVNKINGLANEYTGVAAAVRARWSMGLGKYLLMKAEQSMLGKGALQIGRASCRERV